MSSGQVSKLSGATPRELQWWDQQGLVKPDRDMKARGKPRIYSLSQARQIQIICWLRRRGFSLGRIRKLMRTIDFENLPDHGWLIVKNQAHIYTDAYCVLARMVREGGFWCVIDLMDLAVDLELSANKRRKSHAA